MTSVVQPMDHGIIKNLKHYYQGLIVQSLPSDSLGSNKKGFKIDILQAARMCHNAWAKVTTTTIANWFKKARFKKKSDDTGLLEEDADKWEANGVTFEEYVNLDEEVAVCGELSEEDILAEVKNKKSAELSDAEEEDTGPEAPIATTSEALHHMREFRRYVEGQTDASEAVFNSINFLEDFSNFKKISSAKESDILKYFQKNLCL